MCADKKHLATDLSSDLANKATNASTKMVVPMGGNRFSACLGSILLKISGWEFEGELPQHPKMVIAVAPHTSNWDFFLGVAVLFKLRIKIRFLGKHTIFVPIIKNLLFAIGGMPVDRSSKHGVVKQVCSEFDKQQKMILALSPEGTRSIVFPWKTGFLAIANTAQVPIALVGFDYAKKQIKFSEVIYTTGDFDHDMLHVYRFFKRLTAKYPDKVKYPDTINHQD